MKKRWRLFALIFLLGLLGGVGTIYSALPDETYYLSVSTNGRAPSSYIITDYKIYGDWLWYIENDGGEFMINVHSSQVIIHTKIIKPITNLYEIRENILGAGSTLDSGFKGPADGT